MKARYLACTVLVLTLAAFLTGCARATQPAAPTQAPAAATQAPGARLVLATTTSTADSGLLDYLLPDFERRYNCKVDVVAVGSGQAIKTGQDGNCDVLLVHSRAAEDQFVADGYGVNRLDVMYNDFVLVGPAADPAGVKGLTNAAEALTKIAAAQARFISRGDESGTHVKEKAIWKAAGLTPEGPWYASAGQGMGAVLTMADEQQAYTLADRATYLAQRSKLGLAILVEGDKALFNPYGVIAVNPARHPGVNADLAARFEAWLTSLETQQRIADFGREKFGQALFVPDAEAWRQAHP